MALSPPNVCYCYLLPHGRMMENEGRKEEEEKTEGRQADGQ